MAARPLAPDEQWPGIVYAEGDKKYAVFSWGTACAVSADGYFLTNHHVVKGAQLILVGGWQDSKIIHGALIRSDEKNDLALLKLEAPNQLGYIRFFSGTEVLQEGEEVFVWAYLQIPGGLMQFLRRGIVSNNTHAEGFERYVYIETSALFGTSGSPVFTRSHGDTIGIVSSLITLPGGIPLPAGVIGVIPGETINRFLKEAGVPGY